jgi:hypothetical protein
VAPEHLKATALTLALVSLTLFTFAATDLAAGDTKPADERPRAGWRGGFVLLAVSFTVGSLLWFVSRLEGWSRDRVFWVGCGAFLGVLTLLRPWWFWENYKARWLRNAIGDEPTAIFYLVVSAICIWVGLNTDWTFGRP